MRGGVLFPNAQTHLSKVEPLCLRPLGAQRARAREPCPYSVVITADTPPPPGQMEGRFRNACPGFYPLLPPRQPPWQVARLSQRPGAQFSVISWKGALLWQAGLLHLLLTLPPPRAHRLGSRGRRDPTLKHSLFLCGEEGPPVAQNPCLRPSLGKFPLRDPGRRFFFTLSLGARSYAGSPCPKTPNIRAGAPAPHPAACRGGQKGWRRWDAGSALRSPAAQRTPLEGSGESAQGGVLTEPGSQRSFNHQSPPPVASVLYILGEKGCSVQPPNPNPFSLQCPGEGSSAFQQSPVAGAGTGTPSPYNLSL